MFDFTRGASSLLGGTFFASARAAMPSTSNKQKHKQDKCLEQQPLTLAGFVVVAAAAADVGWKMGGQFWLLQRNF